MTFHEALDRVINENKVAYRKITSYPAEQDRCGHPWSLWVRLRIEEDSSDLFVEFNNYDEYEHRWTSIWDNERLSKADLQADNWVVSDMFFIPFLDIKPECAFSKEVLQKEIGETTVLERIEVVKLGWGTAAQFMEALKTDPCLNHEEYTDIGYTDCKVKVEEWREFYDKYEQHLEQHGTAKDFDFGSVYGVKLVFTETVDEDSYVVVRERMCL